MKGSVPSGTSLDASRRRREIELVGGGGAVDVLVVGGGITGVGVALDAAARGLSVVLAERHDLAFGTSRWSSKLVHGGVRYLASGQVAIARESARERHLLMTVTAPHLVRPFPQLVPLLPHVHRRQAAVMRAGLGAADVLRRAAGTSSQVLPRSRTVGRAEVLRMAPTTDPDGLRGGLVGWDGQLYDDARLVVALARTAAGHGARILTHCAVDEATGTGARLRDKLSGSEWDLDARVVVNATGVWAADLHPGLQIRPSRGTHLVLAQSTFGSLTAGLTVAVPGERNRFVFALPSPGGRVHVGLTDEEAPGEVPDVPAATDDEVDFLLRTMSTVLARPLDRAEVLATYSGLRPLLDSGDEQTADLSRRHAVLTSADGVVTVVGGKLTTYRQMAEDAVDHAVAQARLSAGPCRTRHLPAVGAADASTLARVAAPTALVRRYGTEAAAVHASAVAKPALAERVVADFDTTIGDLEFAVAHEGALTVDDLLDRRTRLGVVPSQRVAALEAAERALG